MVQSKVKLISKSKVKVTLRPTASNQYVLVPSPLVIKGVPSEKFEFGIRIALEPRKTTENVEQIGRSQDLPDAN
jgi:hypothetical protein